MRPGDPRKCVVCGGLFEPRLPGNPRANACSDACRAERKRRANAEWYEKNRQYHSGVVNRRQKAARRVKKKKGGG